MIKSMTGYGKGETKRDGYHITAEIKTINHKYTNIYLHIPACLSALESEMHKMIKDKIDRGRVDLYLNIEEDVADERREPQLNLALAKRYYAELKALEDALGLEGSVTIDRLVTLPEVLKVKEAAQDEETLFSVVTETVRKAIDSLLQMRTHEGREIYHDMVQRLDLIQTQVEEITLREPAVLLEYKNRMRERLRELLEDKVVDETRLSMEIAMLAERSGITEELVRLRSHLGQFRANIEKDEAVGRKLDFIAQEMYREANTIGSKAIDAEIINFVVVIKSEVDKIREQVQNVE